ncbi:MAG: DUF4242 domain-containing protein [Alphaproteobacteria bacterium]|nr:DUF4242 domain-containing protein [Alphaproteobacteria bacterium]
MALVLVERVFDHPVDEAELLALAGKARGCFEIYAVEFLGSLVAKDGLSALCVYRASDTDSVRMAQRSAGLPFTRVFPGWVFASPSAGNLLGTVKPGPT